MNYVDLFENIGGAQARSAVASRFAKPLRMRVCDLLLFTVSSKETPDNVKIVSSFFTILSA